MAKRIRIKSWVKIFRELKETNAEHAPDDKAAEEIIDGLDRGSYRDVNIAATTSEAQTFPDVTTVKGVYFLADSDFDAAINGAAALAFRRLDNAETNTTEKLRMLLQANITSLTLTSPVGATFALTGVLVYVGDPTP
jgi:hypothetical protein